MSANNQLLIHKRYKKQKYWIEDVDVESQKGFKVGETWTLEDAIKFANAYMEVEEVEYGLRINI